jgi:hypothetical protein
MQYLRELFDGAKEQVWAKLGEVADQVVAQAARKEDHTISALAARALVSGAMTAVSVIDSFNRCYADYFTAEGRTESRQLQKMLADQEG